MSDMSDHYDAALEARLLWRKPISMRRPARPVPSGRRYRPRSPARTPRLATDALMEQIYKELSSIKTLLQNHK